MAKKTNTWKILSLILVIMVIILAISLFFGKIFVSFIPSQQSNNQVGSVNIQTICSFSSNSDNAAASSDNVFKCKFRNFGQTGEQCFIIKESRITNSGKTQLGESRVCSGILSSNDYWSDYKFIYSKSWEDYHSRKLGDWLCVINLDIYCSNPDNNSENINYILEAIKD